MTQPERVCPHCGSDRYLARRAKQELEVGLRHRRMADDIARENGLLRFKLSVAEAEARDVHSRLQRKIIKQARVIRRFEERWKAMRKPPYEGEGFNTTPGADFDAAQGTT